MENMVTNHILEIRHLVENRKVNFELEFSKKFTNVVTSQLNLLSLKKMRFFGNLTPLGMGDWKLKGIIRATVEQQCSLTLDPVVTRVDSKFLRNFRKVLDPLVASHTKDGIVIDELDEALNKTIDLEFIFCEELSLLLPDYPKLENSSRLETDYGPPGVSPLTDETSRPFSILSEFRNRLT